MNPVNPEKLKLLRRSVKPVVLVILFVLNHNSISAQEVYDLSRCIQQGLENNFELQIVRNREDILKNNYTRGNAGMFPVLEINNQYGGTVNTSHRSLREGGEISTHGIHNNFGDADLDFGMTIFRGFEVKYNYRKYGTLAEIGGLETQMSVENLVAQIVSEYNYYIEQLTLYENLAYAVSLSRERVRIDEERYLLGSASKLDLMQSLVYLNADSSRYARQKEVLHSSKIRLNKLMASEDPGKDILPEDTLIILNEGLVYDDLLSLTLTQNTSLQIASENQQISELDYKIIQSRSYPYLRATTGYGYAYNGYETGEVSHQLVRGVDYGLSLGILLFDGFNQRRKIANARIEIENSNIRYQEIEQEVRADLMNIYFAYKNNLRLLRLEEQNLEVARENLEIALERYKLGALSGLELREVQKSLLDAEERLISVKYETKLAEISLLQISGSIMEYL